MRIFWTLSFKEVKLTTTGKFERKFPCFVRNFYNIQQDKHLIRKQTIHSFMSSYSGFCQDSGRFSLGRVHEVWTSTFSQEFTTILFRVFLDTCRSHQILADPSNCQDIKGDTRRLKQIHTDPCSSLQIHVDTRKFKEILADPCRSMQIPRD